MSWRREQVGDAAEHSRVFPCGAKAVVFEGADAAEAEVYRVAGGRRERLLPATIYPSLAEAQAACEAAVGPRELTLAEAAAAIAAGDREFAGVIPVAASEAQELFREALTGYNAAIDFEPGEGMAFKILLGGAGAAPADPPAVKVITPEPQVVEHSQTIPQAVELDDDEQPDSADDGEDDYDPQATEEITPLARKLLQQGRGDLKNAIRAGYHYEVVDKDGRRIRKDDPRYPKERDRCYKDWRKRNGLCASYGCSKPRLKGMVLCEVHTDERTSFTREQLAAVPPFEPPPPGEISAHAKALLELGGGNLKNLMKPGIHYDVVDKEGNTLEFGDPGYEKVRTACYNQWRSRNGLCQKCNNPAREGRVLCADCAEEKAAKRPARPDPPKAAMTTQDLLAAMAGGWKPQAGVDYEVRDKDGRLYQKGEEGYSRAKGYAYRNWRIASGICRDCNSPRSPDATKCADCTRRAAEASARHAAKKKQQPAAEQFRSRPRLRIGATDSTT